MSEYLQLYTQSRIGILEERLQERENRITELEAEVARLKDRIFAMSHEVANCRDDKAEVARLKGHAEAMALVIETEEGDDYEVVGKVLADYRRDYPGGDHGPDQQGD